MAQAEWDCFYDVLLLPVVQSVLHASKGDAATDVCSQAPAWGPLKEIYQGFQDSEQTGLLYRHN